MIGPNVTLGKDVVLSARCVLGRNVVLPDKTVLAEETRSGQLCFFFNSMFIIFTYSL